MDAQHEQRVESLFQQTLELPTDQHDSFLRAHCDDSEILRRVETLLKHHAEARGNFLAGPTQSPPGQPTAPGNDLLVSGAGTIAHYRLVRVIGEGGMGIVYEAEEDRPKRKVALKVIRRGFATPAMLRRFEYEADVLARLDHPGVARIHHAGIADSGLGPQPYFAMELVQGVRLDEWISLHSPVTIKRLKLLIEICDAVHHAHTKGVIHRDLKPSNILITPDGRPKILDFGVARATDADIQSTTLHTESGQIIGTLPYMAPEQASGRVNDLDTSSDVYALGVIAYELLSGTMPYSLEGKALHEAVRVICEQEPSRLSSINRSLRGDVETIVQKALEKDKSRRYHTAGEMGADVKRFLDYEPITARRPGTWYQLGKFARRNKLLVSAVAAVMLTLATGAVISTYFAITAGRQRAEAEERRAESDAVSRFLTSDVLAGASPENLPDKAIREVVITKLIEPAASRVGVAFKDNPRVEAAVRNALAMAFDSVGRSEAGEPHARRALELRRQLLGDDHPNTLTSINNLAMLLQAQGKLAEAEPLYREAFDRYRRVHDPDDPDTVSSINNLGYLLFALGKSKEAEPLFREAVMRNRRVLGEGNAATLASVNNLAAVLQAQGMLKEAESLMREQLDLSRRSLGIDHPNTLGAMNTMGYLLHVQGRFDEAESLWVEALQRRRRVLGDDHPDTLESINNLAESLHIQGRLREAESLKREVLERSRRRLGDYHTVTFGAVNNLAALLQAQGKLPEAELLLRDLVVRIQQLLGNDHPYALGAMNNLASLLHAQGKIGEAESLFRQSLEQTRRILGDQHLQTLNSIDNLVGLLYRQGRLAEAEPLSAELYRHASSVQIAPQQAALYLANYGPCLEGLGRHAESEEPLRVAYERIKATGQQRNSKFQDVLRSLGEVADHTNRPEEAAKWRAELAALQAATHPASGPTTSPAPATGPAATAGQ